MTLGEKIYQLRKQEGLSQDELASKITVSRQSISKWELGEAIPDTENVVQISQIFNVSLDYLLIDEVTDKEEIPVVKEAKRKVQKKHVIGVCVFCLIAILLLLVGYYNNSIYTSTIIIFGALLVVLIIFVIRLLILLFKWLKNKGRR